MVLLWCANSLHNRLLLWQAILWLLDLQFAFQWHVCWLQSFLPSCLGIWNRLILQGQECFGPFVLTAFVSPKIFANHRTFSPNLLHLQGTFWGNYLPCQPPLLRGFCCPRPNSMPSDVTNPNDSRCLSFHSWCVCSRNVLAKADTDFSLSKKDRNTCFP